MSVKIIDNFMPVEIFKEFQPLMRDIPWYTSLVLPKEDLQCDPIYNFMFAHMFYQNNIPATELYYQFVEPLLPYIPIRSLIRAKINLNPRTEKIVQHGYHVDNEFNDSFTSILYLNTNNGYTEFKNGTKVESIENRFVTFPTYYKHAGSTCTDEPCRVTLNINYF